MGLSTSSSINICRTRSMESLLETSTTTSRYFPLIEEVRVSSVVSRRGYLNFLEEKGTGWVKKFVVRVIHILSTSEEQ